MDSNEAKFGFVIALGRFRFQDAQTAPRAVGGRLFLKQRVSFSYSIQYFRDVLQL